MTTVKRNERLLPSNLRVAFKLLDGTRREMEGCRDDPEWPSLYERLGTNVQDDMRTLGEWLRLVAPDLPWECEFCSLVQTGEYWSASDCNEYGVGVVLCRQCAREHEEVMELRATLDPPATGFLDSIKQIRSMRRAAELEGALINHDPTSFYDRRCKEYMRYIGELEIRLEEKLGWKRES